MPQKISAQYKIKCESPTTCDGWLYHNNKIGIGTGWGGEAYIPRTTLHLHEFNSVNTFINITNQTTGFPQGSQTLGMFIGMMGNKAMISNFQNDNLVLATGTNERLVVTSTGNTGVGISTPQNVLHLHKSIGTIPQLNGNEGTEIKSLTATTAYGLQITNQSTGSSATNGLLVGLAANGSARIVQQGALSLSLGVNNADVVNINSSGNVGIGTTNPTAKLHTNGTIRIENLPNITAYTNEKILLLDAQGNAKQALANLIGDNLGNHTASQNIKLNDKWISNDADNEGIKISNQGDVLIYGNPTNGTKTFEQNNGFEIVTRGRIPERRGISVDEDANGIPAGNFNFWIHNWQNPAAFNFMRNDQGTTKKLMTITKQGYVGINIDNPTANLHTNGSIRFEQLPQQSVITNEDVLISDAQGAIKVSQASQLKDNLGNHTATKNINIGANWLSPNGNDKGIQLKDNGNVQVGSGITQINFGGAYSNAPLYLSNYIGFNAQRNDNGQWTFSTDGANNGGAAIISDISGNLLFVSNKPQSGSSNTILNENEVIAKTRLFIKYNGSVGIGTISPDDSYLLDVRGAAHFCKVVVKSPGWCDFVFSNNYELMPLNELKSYIEANKHLPGIPTEKEIEENDIDLTRMNQLLLQKIEELTLYVIKLQDEINILKQQYKIKL
ncbi:MAG TPA: hypothetical protein PLP65_07485 [Bacteroidales bacterium]|nr:hypothetical protein [Bacteroidales bacterium]